MVKKSLAGRRVLYKTMYKKALFDRRALKTNGSAPPTRTTPAHRRTNATAAAPLLLPLPSDLLFRHPPPSDIDFTMNVRPIARAIVGTAKTVALVMVLCVAAWLLANHLVASSTLPDWLVQTTQLFVDQPFKTIRMLLLQNITSFGSGLAEVDKAEWGSFLLDIFVVCLDATARVMFGMRSSLLITLFPWQARAVAAASLTALSIHWDFSQTTIFLSFVIPLLPLSTVAYLLDQWALVPLLGHAGVATALATFVPRCVSFWIIAIRSHFYFGLGTYVMYKTNYDQETTLKGVAATFLWFVMSANALALHQMFRGIEDPDDFKELLLMAGICGSVWAVIWTSPWLGETYFDNWIF